MMRKDKEKVFFDVGTVLEKALDETMVEVQDGYKSPNEPNESMNAADSGVKNG